MRNYTLYDTIDFLLDEYFQQWVKSPDVENEVFWENFITINPEKRKVIAEAKRLILYMDFQRDTWTEMSKSQIVLQKIKASNKTKVSNSCIDQVSGKPALRLHAYHLWFLIAYGVLFVLGCYLLLNYIL